MQHGNYFKQGKNNLPPGGGGGAGANQEAQQHYNKYLEGQIMPLSSQSNNANSSSVIQASQGTKKAVNGSAGSAQAQNSQLGGIGSNRNTNQAQARSRLSNNEGVADDDSESDENSEEDDGAEPPEMRVSPEFLKNLPGVQASDSMGYRIEALRVYLETQLGEQPFIAAYQHFVNMSDGDDPNIIDQIIGPKKMKFLPLIHQLISCEDNYYSNG